MELRYAQIKNGEVMNIAVFADPPPETWTKLFGVDAHVFVPDDLPVGIGDTWDGMDFKDTDGNIIVPPENEPPEIPEEG